MKARTFDFSEELLRHRPAVWALANSLCRQKVLTDDISQETLTKAWASRNSYTPGTNFRAWVFTILRNSYYSHLRRSYREVQDVDGALAQRLMTPPCQELRIEFCEMVKALDKLPADQRQAMLLIGLDGSSYEEAARTCNCAIGTVKSRVARGRAVLSAMLQ